MRVQIPPNHPFSDFKLSLGAVAERRVHFAVDEDDDGWSPFGPAIFSRTFTKSVHQDQLKGEQHYVCTKESVGLYTFGDVNLQLFLVR